MTTTYVSVSKKVKQGFTLLELMIAIAIIGILAAIGVPAYNTYIYKARVSELLSAAAPAILSVNEYVITNAQTESIAIPASLQATTTGGANSHVEKIAISANGTVTVTGKANTGPTTPTVITYTPTLDTNGNISWKCTSGPASNQKYAPGTCQS